MCVCVCVCVCVFTIRFLPSSFIFYLNIWPDRSAFDMEGGIFLGFNILFVAHYKDRRGLTLRTNGQFSLSRTK